MRYELFLAMRYLGGLRREQPFVSVIAAISVCGVAVGVAALLVVLGVMSGFDADLTSKIIGNNPHLVVRAEGLSAQNLDPLYSRILQFPHVKAASPYLETQVLLQFGGESAGVILRGMDPLREPGVTGLSTHLVQGAWPPQPGQLLIGSELSKRWGLTEGSPVNVIAGEKLKSRPMMVGGFFTTGMYEYDMNLVLGELSSVQELLGVGDRISGIGVKISDPMQADEVRRKLQRELGFPYGVTSWMDMNQNLFAALKLEKVAMFVILTLIVLVASFNIVATLLMMVVGRTKEVGILKAMGAAAASIRKIFTWVGLLIGVTGTIFGTAAGLGLCLLLERYQFITLPASIYYIDRLPVKLEPVDAGAVILAALGIAWCACLYPAWVAARRNPAEAIRYE